MITSLRLKDYALVEELVLEPGGELCLLTGETGAGKSILVDAVGLLAGNRAETEMVRTGAEEAVIEGSFRPSLKAAEVAALLRGWDLAFEGELVIRRRIQRSGRNTVTLNGAAITLAQLRELGALLVEIHGQNQSQTLLDEETHRRILDALPSVSPAADALRAASTDLSQALSRWRTLSRSEAERAQRLDLLRFQMEEIDRVAPRAGEEEELLASKSRLQNVERIAEAVGSLHQLLAEGDPCVRVLLSEATRWIEALKEVDPDWGGYLADLRQASGVLSSIASEAERTASTISFDPEALERTLQRLADLDRLKRKYGPTLDDLLAHRASIGEEAAQLSGGEATADGARERIEASFAEYMRRALELSSARKVAALEFGGAVEAELKPLAMERARFLVELVPRPVGRAEEATEAGLEEVRFLFSSNPGVPPKPLAKIASGGELSRTLLALLTATRQWMGTDTIIFDEVDAGIGGRPAERVGRRLRRLAEHHQVLCITHLPQIAAFAHQHIIIEKVQTSRRTCVTARTLGPEDRERELARMLAGERIQETALRHARTLLASASAAE
ncbi:MAG: DNA repair protein RecN [Acidobacteriota bacterium]